MKIGKISESVLKRSVLKPVKHKVSGIAVDASSIAIPDSHILVASTDPITCATTDIPMYAVNAAVNDIVVTGAVPMGILITILVPTEFMESDLKEMMTEFGRICEKMNIAIMGGHTETTTAVVRPVVNVTALGYVHEDKVISPNNVHAGQHIVMTKGIGIEGTAILAKDRYEELKDRFSPSFIRQCADFINDISIIEECKIAGATGVTAMHDVSEGGVFGALWEMATGNNIGLEVELKDILVHQETIELCEIFDINPYTMLSGGTVLMATDDGEELVNRLMEKGIKAAIIGRFVLGNDKVIINGDERRFLEPPKNSLELNIPQMEEKDD